MITITEAWHRWQRHAYGFREVALAILVFGIYLHLSRLVFGDDLVQNRVLLPSVDKAFGVVMRYAEVTGVVGWQALRFRTIFHRRISRFILGFITVSVPIHVATFYRTSAAQLSVLPWWYSFVEGALLYPAFGIAVLRIRYAADTIQ